ncbi:MAG TPA: DUF6502 family protein [Gammaproteobacteria bacterium]|nr:DUF6502 family protein [Gammaproteobacteria bacterium]
MPTRLKRAAFASTRLLLRPVVRLLVRCGVTWKELAELCKLVYVEVAAADFGKRGRPTNASRIAILTGLSRREVKRAKELLSEQGDSGFMTVERINHASRVLSAWYQDAEFRSANNGKPRLLPLEGESSFSTLAKRYAPDIPPTAMLKELRSVGAIRITPEGKIRALARYFMPMSLDPAAVVRVGSVLRDLGDKITYNQLRGDGERSRFEGRATNVRVRRVARRAFAEYLESRGMAFLEDVDSWLSAHEAKNAGEKTDRIGVGVYLIMDDDEASP